MLTECDFVSVHCVLTEETRGMIGAAEFEAMKSSAIFINTARGAIVDEKALLHAVKTNQISGAGLDVYSLEPLNRNSHPLNELYDRENVILMPHLTFYTHESVQRLEHETLDRCVEVLTGQSVLVKSCDNRLTSQQFGVNFRKPPVD